MAIVSNTFRESAAVANREELMGVVHRVAPEDTPIYSSIPKGKATSIHPEWVTDDLAAPASNAQAEGDQYSYTAVTPAGRPGNYTQILRNRSSSPRRSRPLRTPATSRRFDTRPFGRASRSARTSSGQ